MPKDNIDNAYNTFLQILENYELYLQSEVLKTESDTRVKVIDPLMHEVLGWGKEELLTEERSGKGFLDYKYSIEQSSRLIIEAKKDSRIFNLTHRNSARSYNLSGPALKNSDLQEGIDQAINYSAHQGAELACVTNGHEWVIFRSNRSREGKSVLSGKAFVFCSLNDIKENFALFYDLVSRAKVANYSYRAIFQETEGRVIRTNDFDRSIRTLNSANFIKQAQEIASLDKIMTSFFQRITNEKDSEMLEKCFVETKESKAAEQRLLRIAEDIVGSIKALNTKSGAELSELLKYAQSSGNNQFILLIGAKGSGKSTFVQRFFNMNLPPEMKKACIDIRINLSDSEGDEERIHEWLRNKLLDAIETSLQGQTPTWDELIGHMFFSEYQRWSRGSMKYLYESDKEEFKIRFGTHIESMRKDKPDEYIQGLIRNILMGRKQLPCLIFDNADHFSIDFQEKVFQVARSIYENTVCVVIMPITDKTSWQLSRQGALQSFENESLLLPTPSPKMVVEKRFEFVMDKIHQENKNDKEKDSYFWGKGIKVNIEDLTKFITAIQEVLLNSKESSSALGRLSNHDIRQVLELSRNLINSPHIGFDDLFKTYITGTNLSLNSYKVDKSLIKGRYDIYKADANKFVKNIYELNSEFHTSPLTGIRILQAIKDAQINKGDTKTRFIEKAELYEYLINLGIEHRVLIRWLDALLKGALVYNYDPTVTNEADATKLEISPSGEIHIYWGLGNMTYIYAMAEVTNVLEEQRFIDMKASYSNKTVQSSFMFTAKFIEYLMHEDGLNIVVPEHVSYNGQNNILKRLASSGRYAMTQAKS